MRERALHNLSPWTGRCTLVRATSDEFMRVLLRVKSGIGGIKRRRIDLIYIDASHHATMVAEDSRQALLLLRPGGWMMFDDLEQRLAKRDWVKEGIALFLAAHGDEVREVFTHGQMQAFEKL